MVRALRLTAPTFASTYVTPPRLFPDRRSGPNEHFCGRTAPLHEYAVRGTNSEMKNRRVGKPKRTYHRARKWYVRLGLRPLQLLGLRKSRPLNLTGYQIYPETGCTSARREIRMAPCPQFDRGWVAIQTACRRPG